MPETLGSLCDKLTIIKLKQFHSDNVDKSASLAQQEKRLQREIDVFVQNALSGLIPSEDLTFLSNKIYKADGHEVRDVPGGLGEIVGLLAMVNCELWHEQEKIYDFKNVPDAEKNAVIERLAILNLERNKCIDSIDEAFAKGIDVR